MNFLYARVSSIAQNIDRQVEETEKYDRVYVDKCSGKNADRPALLAMLSNLRAGDTVTCHSLDRLARNTFDLLSLVKQITEAGCSVEFLKERLKFSSGTPNSIDNLTLHILAAIAEFERELIKGRQAEGIAVAKSKGKFKGGTKKLSDYDIEELIRIVTNKKMSMKKAAERYGITTQTVRNYVRRYKNP
ncbi:MAG: recombinase family protein [Alphaproteobacteria bacterium]|nr:recombinase family protein [Alphaproteobacteria bacterium]